MLPFQNSKLLVWIFNPKTPFIGFFGLLVVTQQEIVGCPIGSAKPCPTSIKIGESFAI